MPANIDPIYTRVADIQNAGGFVVTAHTATDLSSGTSYQVFAADSTNGGFIRNIRIKQCGGSTGISAATVVRVWIGTATTAGNHTLYTEVSIPSFSGSNTNGLPDFDIPLNIPLPPSYKVWVSIGTTITTGFFATAIGGKY